MKILRGLLWAWMLTVPYFSRSSGESLLARTNLMAWCIVPFDAAKRGPEERAQMLQRLGIRHFAYDYRAEHIPTFDAEIAACRRHGISIDAWWFPGSLNDEARLILDTIGRHRIHPQLWITGGGGPVADLAEQKRRVGAEAERLAPIARLAQAVGCVIGLYNHGGWFGHPTNQVAIIGALKNMGLTNAGIVYNQHHGHDHVEEFERLLGVMKPHLIALNLNGMTPGGDRVGRKILPIGQGELDEGLTRAILRSGWKGPVGILNHTDEDAEARLQDNLDGLDWISGRISGDRTSPRPAPKSWKATQ